MKLDKRFIEQIERCETKNQLERLLKERNVQWVDDSSEVGCFSIWLDGRTRVYKPCGSRTMRVQTWRKVEMNYSGVPVFFE